MDRREFLKTSGWTLLGLAAVNALPGCSHLGDAESLPDDVKGGFPSLRDLKVFWGDVHNHCNVTYGHGDLSDALAAAEQQLDFVSVTPHAMWPDIPGENDPRLNWVIGYHTAAFRRLRAGGYEKYRRMIEAANRPGKFLTFVSYECHSMEHGDHVALFRDFDVPLVECTSVPDLKEKLRGYACYVTPHHMGYQTGFRGYNWAAFPDNDPQTPFVEMFSRHGLAESDTGDYDYLHDMGPRVWEGSILYGLEQGHKFGLMCSTDQHAGYPGSYGDGRIGVYAPSLERETLWKAMGQRHVCGVTGDKIKIDFRINSGMPGDVIRASRREIYLNVEAQNAIDYVDLIKNGQCVARLNGPYRAAAPSDEVIRTKVKVNFGWNREEEYVHWTGRLSLDGGTIDDLQTCFRGAAFTSPQPGETEFHTRVNRVLEHDAHNVVLDLYSTKNPNVMTPAMQGVVLDLTAPRTACLVAEFNGQRYEHTIGELLEGARAHFLRGWLSEAIQFERAQPEAAFCVGHRMVDKEPQRDTDYYYVRVRQRDGQWGWSSPIWVERA
ncbi:Tat pathway signal sequence [Alistipes sp. An116]|uniref:Tat pathway signal sequence n=1 Tax=Alistipes sp. An116 TaxID=1965546 RepID=UPI000B3A0080|nr:Tat pathway signal sequence [Alistipes sp. An116]OUQ54508.1 Tat pathway signal sequence [Alistipes sp. An116]